jgi:hypothetical protein
MTVTRTQKNKVDTFIRQIKNMLVGIENSLDKESKSILALQLFKNLNEELNEVIEIVGIDKWVFFVIALFQKIEEIEQAEKWKELSKEIKSEIYVTKKTITKLITKYNISLKIM